MKWNSFFVLLLVVCAGCKPGVGTSCDKGEARCQDKQTQLACQGGKYIATPCRGPGGCSITPDGIHCDISKNKPGDPCSTDDVGAAAGSDEKTLIACVEGKYQPSPCRGPKGCTSSDGRPTCDTSIAAPGDACKDTEKPKGCSTDGKQLLTCQSGKMALSFWCRGPDGCSAKDGKLDCDLSVAKLDDPCIKEMEGKNACALDRKAIVVCKGSKFVVDEKCEKKGESCLFEGGSIRCGKPD